MAKLQDHERSSRLAVIPKTQIKGRGDGLSLFRQTSCCMTKTACDCGCKCSADYKDPECKCDCQECKEAGGDKKEARKIEADSIGESRGDSKTLEEAPADGGIQSDDDETTAPDKENDSREVSKRKKKYLLEDDDGNEYGNDILRDKPSSLSDNSDEPTGGGGYRHQSPPKTLRGQKMNFKPKKKILVKKQADAGFYTVEEIAQIDKGIAQAMKDRGVTKLHRETFDKKYAAYKKQADHNYRMSDHWRKEKANDANPVEYYDNWDVEWTLYKANDHVKRGSRVGDYKSADAARRAALVKGDGNYVIEGTAIRDGSYWGYYVVSVKDKKVTRYQKLYVQPKESGVTHENTYRKAVLGNITPEKFEADALSGGMYVRARLSRKASRALSSLYKSGNRVLDEISVGKKQFGDPD